MLVQRLGLEWLHRMAQEPKRLYRRYLLHGIPFLVRLLSSALVVRMSPAGRLERRTRLSHMTAPVEQELFGQASSGRYP